MVNDMPTENPQHGAEHTDADQAGRLRRSGDDGFSLLEALVASFMSVMVVGGMLVILDSLRDLHRDQQQLIDARMTTRLALAQMGRDIQLAGIGLLGMLSPLPVIEPRDDGGIDIRYNSDNLTTRLTNDGGSAHFGVADVSGFKVGMVVAIYDGTGAFDLTTLTTIEADKLHLHHDGGLSKTYTPADGAAVKQVQTTSYQLQTIGDGTFWLQRQQDNDTAQPVATNVRSMTITYYDDSNPSQAFTPVTLADQLRVRTVEVTLVVETEDKRLNTTAERTVTLTVRIAPRSVLLAS